MKPLTLEIKAILKAQAKLDYAIDQKLQALNFSKSQSDRTIALVVEISELANELQFFKYWKENKVLKRASILEEFIDGLHFINSFALAFKIPFVVEAKIVSTNLAEQFLKVYEAVYKMQKNYNFTTCWELYRLYLGIAAICGFEAQAIVKAYFEKNAINFERIKNHY